MYLCLKRSSLFNGIMTLLAEENSESIYRIFNSPDTELWHRSKIRIIIIVILQCFDKVLLLLVFCIHILFWDKIKTASCSIAVFFTSPLHFIHKLLARTRNNRYFFLRIFFCDGNIYIENINIYSVSMHIVIHWVTAVWLSGSF